MKRFDLYLVLLRLWRNVESRRQNWRRNVEPHCQIWQCGPWVHRQIPTENKLNLTYCFVLIIIGLGKILKKYEKRTGGVLRVHFIERVWEQPFFTTDLISKLVKDCETTIEMLPPSTATGIFHEEEAPKAIFRNSVAALLSMQEMRRGSSTYSQFSLPPLNLPDFELIQSLQLISPIQIHHV